jgi:hypothetical protein
MKKIKFTQANFHERLSQIIQDFPKLDVSIKHKISLDLNVGYLILFYYFFFRTFILSMQT